MTVVPDDYPVEDPFQAGQDGGFDALDYRKIKHGDAGKLGKYDILSVLPDKFARFLYEFHDFRFSGLDLPPLPADRSDFDVHVRECTSYTSHFN